MKKGKKIIVLILILIIIAIAGGVYAYISTDILKTPSQLFKKYLVNNIEQVSNFNMNPLTDALERMKNEKSEFYINASLDESALSDTDDGNKDTLKLSAKTYLPNDEVNVDVSLKQGDDEILDMSIAIAEDILGIKIDELYDKYIAVENRDLKKLAETLGVDEDDLDEIPDKIEKSTVEFTEEEKETIENLREGYLTKLFDAISDDKYTSEKNVAVTLGDEVITTSKYTLTITNAELGKIIIQLSKELLDDQDFIALCQDRIDDEKLEELREKVDDELKELDEIDEDEIKTFNISVYASKGNVVKTECSSDEGIVYFAIINNDNESTMYISSKSLEDEDSDDESNDETSIILDNKVESESGTCTLEIKQGDESVKVVLSSTIQEDEIAYQLSLEGDDDDIKSFNKAIKLKFGFKFGDDIEVETIDSDNAEIINDYTEEDFNKLYEEIQSNLEKSVEENPNSIFARLLGNSTSDEISDFDYTSDSDEEDDDEDYYVNINSNINDTTISLNQNDEENEKEQVEEDIKDGLNSCLNRYKMALSIDSEANLGEYLTVEGVQEYCGDNYILGLIDGSIIKCELTDSGNVYYATMEIDGDNLEVINVTVYSEDEYTN